MDQTFHHIHKICIESALCAPLTSYFQSEAIQMQNIQNDMVLVPISLLISMSKRLAALSEELACSHSNPIATPKDVKHALMREFAFAANYGIPLSNEVGIDYDEQQGRS
jgi:hypothetical protein